ncbi:hypothetical protein FB45DRAFT_806424 [Roridomyces roridus]|uniref:F-box domain-containing protein n=1 Tax=Roridomyces roridus TaxID=1738132 RepID=A0AAD7B1X3_9AGAR|nr:hypothetical protein FB45DRAFT_806424 [Roridomyces roridus]
MSAALRSRLSTIDDQILALQTERQTIVAQLSAFVYPVLSLPDDVTSGIFLQYADDYPSSTCNPMILARVCWPWRTVALSTPRLWSRFERCWPDRTFHNYAHLSDFIRMWLSRSGTLPLDLRLEMPSKEELVDTLFSMLADHAARLRNLQFDCATGRPVIHADRLGPLPALTKLSLANEDRGVYIPQPLDVPRLREVELELIALILTEDWEAWLPWSQITNLRILNMDSSDCLTLVKRTLNLEVLDFNAYGSRLGQVVAPPHALHHLHTLILGSSAGADILPRLMLPTLRELRSREQIVAVGPFVADLIGRSGCSLGTMAFVVRDSTDVDAMKSCLLHTPALRVLEIHCDNKVTSQTLDKLFSTWFFEKKLVPSLASLQLNNCCTKFQLSRLVDMLTVRCTRGSLRSFKMTSPETAGATNRGLEELYALRSSGLEVDISPDVQWLDLF